MLLHPKTFFLLCLLMVVAICICLCVGWSKWVGMRDRIRLIMRMWVKVGGGGREGGSVLIWGSRKELAVSAHGRSVGCIIIQSIR